MKTKKFNKYIILSLIFCLLTACNADFLEEINPNQPTEDTYWKTAADAEGALATIYSPVRGQMYGYFGAYTGFQNQNVRGDDVYPIQDDPAAWQTTIFTNDANNGLLSDDWSLLYRSIGRSNNFLANIDRVEMDATTRNEMKGEALFLRAWNYFMLVINWGDVPLRTTPIESSDQYMMASSSEADVWKQIENDLTEAKSLLPLTRPANQKGRVERGAASAYLGKAYVYQGKYAEAKAELGQLMASPYSYDLVTDYEDNYTESNEFNEESIFEINYYQYGTGGVWGNDGEQTPQVNILGNFVGSPLTGGWYKIQPSPSLIDEFTIEERPSGSDSRWDIRMYTNFFFKYSDYGDVKPDEIFYPGFLGNDEPVTMDALWKATDEKRRMTPPTYSDIDGVEGRFIIKKFTAFWSDMGDSMYHSEKHTNNIRVFRFAEVLLLYAEACAQTNDVAGASAALKRIRDRAGLGDKTWSGTADLMEEIEHQRILEFWMEGHRFYDLKRWYSASQVKDILTQRGKLGVTNFQPKHFYYSIPASEMNANTEIENHPLWR